LLLLILDALTLNGLINARYRCTGRQFWIFNDLIIDNLLQCDVVDMSCVARLLWLKYYLLSMIEFLLYRDVAKAKVGIC
jgi:hypothetical protein